MSHFNCSATINLTGFCQVDATILEVGVGGAYDCTNIVPKPIVTGVSALGIDHVAVLGKTIKEIAWQKGGIYKVLSFLLRELECSHLIPLFRREFPRSL